ncbi:MAG: precorrin-6y C5,15-methyltransferase (decarboxylating) subunit CbiE [bacterium]
MPKVLILGVTDAGLDSLSPEAHRRLGQATLLIGGERHLTFCAGHPAEKLVIQGDLKALAVRLQRALDGPGARPVVLASGDPLFYGIASYLAGKLGSERVEVLPNVGSMQQAFARVGWKWDDAELVSVHGRPLERLCFIAPDCVKVGVFTDPDNSPAKVAETLLALGWPEDAEAGVLENLDGPDERVTKALLRDVGGLKFGSLNVVVARRPAPTDSRAVWTFGLDEEAFVQRRPEKGLITKSEVRVLSLAKMRLFPGAVSWDIGAATGSVAVEAARLSRGGRVWAVEKNAEDCNNVRENVRHFHTPTVRVLQGTAPQALADIPPSDDPDAVFVGGTAGRMDSVLDVCLARLRPGGSVVVNTVTVENTAEALAWYENSGLDWGFLQVQINRGRVIRTPTQALHRLDALNPVHVFWGAKPAPQAQSSVSGAVPAP